MLDKQPKGWIVTLAVALLATAVAQRLDAQPLITWGENYDGQCGEGTSSLLPRAPYPYTQLVDVVQGDLGRTFSVALRSNGTVQT